VLFEVVLLGVEVAAELGEDELGGSSCHFRNAEQEVFENNFKFFEPLLDRSDRQPAFLVLEYKILIILLSLNLHLVPLLLLALFIPPQPLPPRHQLHTVPQPLAIYPVDPKLQPLTPLIVNPHKMQPRSILLGMVLKRELITANILELNDHLLSQFLVADFGLVNHVQAGDGARG
jgi:hypothetical protein